MPQNALASVLGISAQYWNDIERDRRRPTPELALKVIICLDPSPLDRIQIGNDWGSECFADAAKWKEVMGCKGFAEDPT